MYVRIRMRVSPPAFPLIIREGCTIITTPGTGVASLVFEGGLVLTEGGDAKIRRTTA